MMEKTAKTSKIKQNLKLFSILHWFIANQMHFFKDALLKFQKGSIEIYGLDPLYCISLPGYNCECNLFESKREVKYIRDKGLYLLIGRRLRGGLSGVRGSRHFKYDASKVLTHDDNNVLFGFFMTQYLAYAKILFDENTSFETILTPINDSKIGYKGRQIYIILIKKQKAKYSPFCLKYKILDASQFLNYLKNVQSHKPVIKVICEQTDKNY